MALSQKAIRIFSAVEVLREGKTDVRHALATLFKPALSAFDGQLFDPAKLALLINQQYKLGVSRDVIEEFGPIFEDTGCLERLVGGNNHIAYLVKCPPDTDMETQAGKFSAEAKELAQEFRAFIQKLSPLSQVERSDEELIDILVDWLMRLDSLTEQEMKAASSVQRQGHKLVYEFSAPPEVPTSDNAFLAARFVKHLFDTSSGHVSFLTQLAGVGLITEVVRDFYKPNTAVNKTDLIVYLDAPVMLDYLGLSGTLEKDNIRGILDRVVAIGGKLRIFRFSIIEAEKALTALLARPPTGRQGPTADAMRRGEVLEQFVRRVSQNADQFINACGVNIVDQSLDQFPNEHKFFDQSATDDMYSQIGWIREDAPRHHDSAITALTMRKRAGTRSSDVFETKHVVITRNPFFPKLARRISADRALIGPRHVGPVIHQRQLATAIWLRAGAGEFSQEIPRRYILAACSRVLTLRKNIVQKVHQLASGLSLQQTEQLELLMMEDRSTQVLMDRTLGSASLIDTSNLPTLLEEMKKAAAQEAYDAADEKVTSVKATAAAQKRALSKSLHQSEKKATELSSALSSADEKRFRVIEKALGHANRVARLRRMFISLVSIILFIAIEFASLISSDVDNQWKWIALSTILIAVVAFHLRADITRLVLDPVLSKFDRQTLDKRIERVGLESKEVHDLIYYDNGRFVLK